MAESLETGEGEYTKDGTVDLKGNPVLRSKRGGWTACSFVVVYEVFERMAFYGISSNLVVYLTDKLHQGTVKSSNNVTNWVGTVWMMPILGAYVADAHLGRYWTFIIASTIYLAGMCLITLAVSLSSLKPTPCGANTTDPNCTTVATPLQLGVFFTALYILAVGTGGTKPNISTIGADQFDEFDPRERAYKLSFFNWWMFSIFFGTFFANTVLVYIQDNVGWTLGYALPTVGLAVSVAIFVAGTPFYRHKLRSGSPFTKMSQVLVAAARNWKVALPTDPKELYELELEYYKGKGKFRIDSTTTLRFLNKAAVQSGHATSRWTLCPVTQVEETKQILRMIPILFCTFIPSTMIAQINTLFIKQGATLDRHIGGGFKVPPASLAAFVTGTMLVSVVVYDRVFVRAMKKLTNNPRGITLLQRMGIGMSLHILVMSVASLTERQRLDAARRHGVVAGGGTVPVTIFMLLPQFVLMGVADAFLEVAKIEFFYDQAPEGMKSLGTSYSMTSLGVGNFLSSFLLSTVADVTRRDGRRGWILNNLNESRLDCYYAFFAALNFLNLVFFLAVSRFYVYRAEFSHGAAEERPVAPLLSDSASGK
ncbi:protein NRT1/ PTR FAMILY 5.2-like [Iris pallida]|uniref:Protein NRT1/ PTR FAMILY 5.2-like n=2 Tax=Iris pallida TaxID=29817 RepID=A0AAX6IFN7_IRIPA|nr:protein NRT1/ PTR FAMILY 5.2-like [Iris pallida]